MTHEVRTSVAGGIQCLTRVGVRLQFNCNGAPRVQLDAGMAKVGLTGECPPRLQRRSLNHGAVFIREPDCGFHVLSRGRLIPAATGERQKIESAFFRFGALIYERLLKNMEAQFQGSAAIVPGLL